MVAFGVIADAGGVGGESALVFDEFAVGEQEIQELVECHVRGGAGAEARGAAVDSGHFRFEFRARGRDGGCLDEMKNVMAVDVFGGIHAAEYAVREGCDARQTR